MGKTTLYIEGSTDTDNGNLRKAFSKLLSNELKQCMPRIKMGDGIEQTVDKFCKTPMDQDEERYLLVDSDRFISSIPAKKDICNRFNKARVNRKIDSSVENTFFMVQEAEAWILSQPDVLSSVGINIQNISVSNVEQIEKPSQKLAELYKKNDKVYSKVREFVKVFCLLDSQKLKETHSEYRDLIEKLKK